MAEFQTHPSQIDVLVVYDISTQSAGQLAESFVGHTPKFDLILIIGPFTDVKKSSTPEDLAVAEGDMASSIAQLENITCRVVYLPGETDPPNTMIEQLHLTPNSVNLYARRLLLRDGLYITGFTETGENLVTRGVPEDQDRSEESDEELEDVKVESGASSIKVMKEILGCVEGEDTVSTETGIFLFSYKFIHTLNHFLFHMGDEVKRANVNLCVIPPITEEASRLPAKFGGLNIIVPKSLKNGGNYTTVRLKEAEGAGWQACDIAHHAL